MLQALHKDLYDAGKSDDYSLGEFMKKVLDKVNSCVGNAHKLTIQTDNQFPNTAVIVDLSSEIDSSVKNIDDVFTFNVQSNKSAVRKFSYNSSVPSSMAATIAVGAAAADDLGSLDEVTFKSMNRGINNRLYTPPPPPSLTCKKQPTAKQIELAKQKREDKITDLSNKIEDLTRYSISILTGVFFKKGGKNKKTVAIQKRNMERMHALTDELLTLDKSKAIPRYNPPSPTPIPIKIDLTLDGISGMVMGQLFRVDESRLPIHYRKRDIHFIIMGEKQEITAGGDWTTIISGQMQLFPEALSKRNVKQGTFSPDISEYDDHIHKMWGLKDGETHDAGNGTKVTRAGNSVVITAPGGAQGYTNNSDGSVKVNANCFAAGTKISMADNITKNIEDIIIGDLVKAFDTNTNTIINSSVLKTFIHPDNKEYYIINNNLKVTGEHPMWVNNDWKEVNTLQIGDKLLYLDGSDIEIESIEIKQETSTVYNFTVDNVHNYFANDYLSHNKCFAKGDKVEMFDGTMKAIELIKIGDEVKSIKDNKVVKGIVTNTLIHPTNDVVEVIKINGITAEPYHPVLVDNKWVPIKALGKISNKFIDNWYNLEIQSEQDNFDTNFIIGGLIAAGLGNDCQKLLKNSDKRENQFT